MKYLVTSALPYANGPLHFGHLAGVYIPADVYTRHRKMQRDKKARTTIKQQTQTKT